MNLTHDAMIVNLRISSWSGRLHDRDASRQVAIAHHADASAGRYNKRLLPKTALAPLANVMSRARAAHYVNTLPWDDHGSRLLPVANYDRYVTALDDLTEEMVRERNRFVALYDDYRDQARIDLGRLFRMADYPSKDALRDRFRIVYRIDPVPDAGHFLVRLADGETERIRSDIETGIREKLNDAVTDLYRRLGDAVEKVSERLREDEDGKPLVFRDSLIGNIRDLVDVVPQLNIFGDADLAHLCAQVRERIASVEIDHHRAQQHRSLVECQEQPALRAVEPIRDGMAGEIGHREPPSHDRRADKAGNNAHARNGSDAHADRAHDLLGFEAEHRTDKGRAHRKRGSKLSAGAGHHVRHRLQRRIERGVRGRPGGIKPEQKGKDRKGCGCHRGKKGRTRPDQLGQTVPEFGAGAYRSPSRAEPSSDVDRKRRASTQASTSARA